MGKVIREKEKWREKIDVWLWKGEHIIDILEYSS